MNEVHLQPVVWVGPYRPNREARDLSKAEIVDRIRAIQRGTEMGATFVETPPTDIGIARRKKNMMILVPRRNRQIASLLME
jgi:hypothetical protein